MIWQTLVIITEILKWSCTVNKWPISYRYFRKMPPNVETDNRKANVFYCFRAWRGKHLKGSVRREHLGRCTQAAEQWHLWWSILGNSTRRSDQTNFSSNTSVVQWQLFWINSRINGILYYQISTILTLVCGHFLRVWIVLFLNTILKLWKQNWRGYGAK